MARAEGTVRSDRVATGSWRSDLFDLEGGHHRPRPVMVASLGTWLPEASPQPAGPAVGPAGDGQR